MHAILRISLIVLATILVPAGASAQIYVPEGLLAQNGSVSGQLMQGGLSIADCGNQKRDRDFALTTWDEDERQLRVTADNGSGAAARALVFAKSRTLYKGVEVDEFRYAGIDDPQLAKLAFLRPTQKNVAIMFSGWDYCAWLGYEPGILNILYKPGSEPAFRAWVAAMLRSGDIETMENGTGFVADETYSNGATIDMKFGSELTVIENLRTQDWMIDYSMRPFPLGPSALIVSLPTRTIDYLGQRTASATAALTRVLRAAFPRTAANKITVQHKGSTAFEVTIFAPMREVAPNDAGYRPYWIRAKIQVAFYANGRTARDFNSYAMINVMEGYLPRWPGQTPPAPAHYTMFQLSDEGATRFKNYEPLSVVEDRITSAMVRVLGGNLID